MKKSNKPDAVNPAIASRLYSGQHWRGVTDGALSVSRGGFEQKETKRTKGASFPSLSSVDSRPGSTDDMDFFSCVSRLSWLNFRRSSMDGRHCESGDIRVDEPWVAERSRCGEPGDCVSVTNRMSVPGALNQGDLWTPSVPVLSETFVSFRTKLELMPPGLRRRPLRFHHIGLFFIQCGH